jgi:hypothetical protein
VYKITNATKRAAVRAAYAKRTRRVVSRITFGHYTVSAGVRSFVSDNVVILEGLRSLSISQALNSGEDATIGDVGSSSYSATFDNPSKSFKYRDKIAFVENGILLEDGTCYYTPCGYFTTEKPETDDDGQTLTVSGYDEIDKMGGKWKPSITVTDTTTLKDIVENIASMHGLSVAYVDTAAQNALNSHVIGVGTAAELTEQSERDVLGFCVGCAGMSARINTAGKLYISWFFSPGSTYDYTVTADVQWKGDFKKSADNAVKVEAITAGVDENVYTKGTGVPLSFANPLVTHAEIDAIYTRYNGRAWYPSTCTWRGDPCIEVGDIITVKDKNSKSYTVYVAQQELDLSGGLKSTITSPNLDTTETSFDTVSASVRYELTKVKNSMEEAIKAATDAINGANGGYYRILDIDKDGNPDGWECYATDGLRGVKCTYGGIGCTTDGGKTFANAMTGEGINATAITTGIITGGTGQFSFNLDTGHISASDIDISGGSINLQGASEQTYYTELTSSNASSLGWKSASEYAAEDEHKPYITADWLTPTSYPTTSPYYQAASAWQSCKKGDVFRLTGEGYNRAFGNGARLDVVAWIQVMYKNDAGETAMSSMCATVIPPSFDDTRVTTIDTAGRIYAPGYTPERFRICVATHKKGTQIDQAVTLGWYAFHNLKVTRTTTEGGSFTVTGSNGYIADLSSGVLRLSYKSGNDTQQFFDMANTRCHSSKDDYKWYATMATQDYTLSGKTSAGFKFGSSNADTRTYIPTDPTDSNSSLQQEWDTTYARIEKDATYIRRRLNVNEDCYITDPGEFLAYRAFGINGADNFTTDFGAAITAASGSWPSFAVRVRDSDGNDYVRADLFAENTDRAEVQLYDSQGRKYRVTFKQDGIWFWSSGTGSKRLAFV